MKQKKKHGFQFADVIPFIVLAVILIAFAVISKGNSLTYRNLKTVIAQSFTFIIGGLGMIFVIAQGGTDISQGALVGSICCVMAFAVNAFGLWIAFPVALLMGALIGCFNGFVVAKLKVSSFMTTISVLIAFKAVLSLFLAKSVTASGAGISCFPLASINGFYTKLAITVFLVVVVGYLFEFTKFGYYSKCIGENEQVLKLSGINVDKYRILAFVISGAMAGAAAVLTLARSGGVSSTTGNMFEMQVMMSIYVGGVAVTGGMSSRIYKLIVGALTIACLDNGMSIVGISSDYSQLMKGAILIIIVAITLFFRGKADRAMERHESVELQAFTTKDKTGANEA